MTTNAVIGEERRVKLGCYIFCRFLSLGPTSEKGTRMVVLHHQYDLKHAWSAK